MVGEADREEHPSVRHVGGSSQSGGSVGSERREEGLGRRPGLAEGLPVKREDHKPGRVRLFKEGHDVSVWSQ